MDRVKKEFCIFQYFIYLTAFMDFSPKNFCQIYSKCFPSGNTREFCDHVFRTFDSDKNGFIDFKEFLLSIDVTSAGTPTEKLEWAFK